MKHTYRILTAFFLIGFMSNNLNSENLPKALTKLNTNLKLLTIDLTPLPFSGSQLDLSKGSKKTIQYATNTHDLLKKIREEIINSLQTKSNLTLLPSPLDYKNEQPSMTKANVGLLIIYDDGRFFTGTPGLILLNMTKANYKNIKNWIVLHITTAGITAPDGENIKDLFKEELTPEQQKVGMYYYRIAAPPGFAKILNPTVLDLVAQKINELNK